MKNTGILTAKQVDELKVPGILTDARCPGLRLVAVQSEKAGRLRKTWGYRYRTRSGVLRQMKLGEYPGMNLQAARDAWGAQKAVRDDPAQGDPRQALRQRVMERKALLDEEKRQGYTVEKLCLDYLREHVEVRRVSSEEPRRLLEREVIPSLGQKAARDIRRSEVHDLVQAIVSRGAPRIAQMMRTELNAAFEHAITAGKLPDNHANPCSKVKAPPQVRRNRAFSENELEAFLKWLPKAKVSRTVREAMHLELLTASRQGEIVAMEWRHVDDARRIWRIPKTKNGRPHEVMLSTQAAALIESRRGLHERYVFPLPSGKGHVSSKAIGIQQYAAKVDLGIPDWTVHDLRRSALTGLARLGCSRPIQDRIANHIDSSVAAIYDRHTYDEEARHWLQVWADALDDLKAGEPEVAMRIVRTRNQAVKRKSAPVLQLVAAHKG